MAHNWDPIAMDFPRSPAPSPSSSFGTKGALDVAHLFNNKAFSDVTINYSGRLFQGHKLVLCTRSEYFDRLLGPDAQYTEANQAELKLEGDDPIALEAFFRHLYTFDYVDDEDLRADDWIYHLNFFIVAQKYGDEDATSVGLSKVLSIVDTVVEPLEIIKIIRALSNSEDHSNRLTEKSDELMNKNLATLSEMEEFRAMMLRDTEKLWNLLHDTALGFLLRKKSIMVCTSFGRCVKMSVVPHGTPATCDIHQFPMVEWRTVWE